MAQTFNRLDTLPVSQRKVKTLKESESTYRDQGKPTHSPHFLNQALQTGSPKSVPHVTPENRNFITGEQVLHGKCDIQCP